MYQWQGSKNSSKKINKKILAIPDKTWTGGITADTLQAIPSLVNIVRKIDFTECFIYN